VVVISERSSGFQSPYSGIESKMIITIFEEQRRNLSARSTRGEFAALPIAFILCVLSSFPAMGQLPSNEIDRITTTAQEKAEIINKPVARQILMASKLLGTSLKKEAISLGRIEELAFDLETEHLAILLLETSETGKDPQWNLIPFVIGDRLIKFAWENKTRLAARPTSLNRMQANELYRSFKEAIYWIDFAMPRGKASGQKFDDHDFQLTLLKEIVDKPIVDKFGEVVGRIEDVAINASKGTIVYMVLRTIDDRRIAVPLGAFAADGNSSRWMIELAKDQILKFKAIDDLFTPSEADAGWLEFVAVKYGRGGLQSKKKEN